MMCRAVADCQVEAVYGVIEEVEMTSGEVTSSVLTMTPACVGHVEFHIEAIRDSVGVDEFTVVSMVHAAGDPGRLT